MQQATGNIPSTVSATQGRRHYHWHIVYRSEAGYPHLDGVPYTSPEAAQEAIRRLAWAPYERPQIIRKDATLTCGGCQ